MSTSPLCAPLLDGLTDDAAVFPPGNAAIDEAIERYTARRRRSRDARFVGSLLVPPALVEQALTEPFGLTLGVVGREGVPLGEVLDAAQQVADHPWHGLANVQVPHTDSWEIALDLGMPVAVEVRPTDEGLHTLKTLAGREEVSAKLRTGATPTSPVPTADELAAFILACVDMDLPFRLTGGLHHAVSHGDGDQREFGLLNVLVAVAETLAGASAGDVASVLDSRGRADLTERSRMIDEDHAHDLRESFLCFGCCEVNDPIGELRDLGLIGADDRG